MQHGRASTTRASDLIQRLASQRMFGATLTEQGFTDPMVDSVFRFFTALWFGAGVLFTIFIQDIESYKPTRPTMTTTWAPGGTGEAVSSRWCCIAWVLLRGGRAPGDLVFPADGCFVLGPDLCWHPSRLSPTGEDHFYQNRREAGSVRIWQTQSACHHQSCSHRNGNPKRAKNRANRYQSNFPERSGSGLAEPTALKVRTSIFSLG